ncbi:MAG TPA: 1,4-dihydroxy-2-naphthoate polyprenyltransferase [Solirubrobacterales bacterium]|nr:1,4-dihydroxy-2-naphthoate polyprenyltransferase [Solirubrobacterales bacterium]HNA43250.1 1,4-dihydroxy-2-naphthoate polyprenyltransferase [Solirubrobacterales bacterium]HNC92401.1 1,4-dihydroxy-2-naphthoate polyprenyltransferase [Solirubrobacterales bacterium]HNF82872.1 1,4-dihydroxy-2-naphthoate polyprenyltransferase [Solirubrobacterales bacterium]HNI38959.1 1,4-dihydroxy-2-naphthoate polyprenyltransferase [Solirubrobacterales bacterium]
MRIWLNAARPRTLPAAIAPVLVGTAAAIYVAGDLPRLGVFLAALAASVMIQIGTNLANDYSDARRGADSADRLGPVRVTSAGLITPQRVLTATWIAFAIAILLGFYIAWRSDWIIIAVGVISIAAGFLYTGGPRPYGYAGLGEVFVFLFFGLVAVNGSYFIQLEELALLPFGLSVSIGFLSTAILVVNNVRDIDSDRRANKNTLAVKIGREKTRRLYVFLVLAAFFVLGLTIVLNDGPWLALIGVIAIPMARDPIAAVTGRTDGPSLNKALAGTGALLGATSILTALGLVLGA